MIFRQSLSLKPHDKVAIISPSSGMPFLFPWVYEQGLDRLRKVFQLEPIEFPTARQKKFADLFEIGKILAAG